MSAEERVRHPMLEAQSVLLDFGGMGKRSGETEGQAKKSLHKERLTEGNRVDERGATCLPEAQKPGHLIYDAKRHTLDP